MSTELKKQAQGTVSKPLQKMGDFVDLFNKYRLQIAQIAPKKGLQADRIIGLCAQVFASAKPAYDGAKTIRDCSPQSIVAAVMQCSMLGLSPIPQRGECYFVPYGDDVQMQIGYQGWILLAQKSATILSVHASCVYEGDPFTPELGSKYGIEHKPGPNYGDPKKVLWAYAIVKMRNGGEQFAILSKAMIERLRLKSPMQNNKRGTDPKGAWATDYDKMACAKAIKQALKLVAREDEWRHADFVDESIARIDKLEEDAYEHEYPNGEYPEGSAELVTEPAKESKEQTEEEKNQAALEKELAKDQNSGGGTLPFNG